MATIRNGILGGFSGKVGNIIGYKYKKRFCIRQVPVKTTKAPTIKQLTQRSKFGISIAFVTGLREALKSLPEKGKKQTSAFNFCLGKVMRDAIAGTYPNFGINYPAAKLTSGSLYNGCRHFVRADETLLTFSWCPGMYNCLFEGTAVLLAYNPVKEQWIYHFSAAGSEDRMAELYLPCNFKGDRVETYMFFVSANGKAVSDSVYTGAVDIPGEFVCGIEINLN